MLRLIKQKSAIFKLCKHALVLKEISIVLPAKSDIDVMFCLQSYQGLRIDISLVYLSYPQDRINTQVICRFAYAQVKCLR